MFGHSHTKCQHYTHIYVARIQYLDVFISPESFEESSRLVEVEGRKGRLGVIQRPKDKLVRGGLDEQLLPHLPRITTCQHQNKEQKYRV